MENALTSAISHIKMKSGILFNRSRIFMDIFRKIFVFRKVLVFTKNTPKIDFQTVSKAEVDVRLAQIGDIPKLARFKTFSVGEAEERLEAGHLCFVAEKNGNIVFYLWVCFNNLYLDELETEMRIEPNSAYFYSNYTIPECRRMGVATAAMTKAVDYLFQNGIKKIYGLIYPDNIPSQRVVKKTRFRKMGEVTLIRLFNSRRYRYKGETPEDYVKLKKMFSI